jgi:metal-dependent amidase/aminoacylase/carboxypeptidase family protein
MSSRGFTVTRQYLGLDTAWRAEFRRGARGVGRIVGVNAEMDALPGIGHGCGHNLIAMAGVAIALALRAALEKHDVPGTVILLGTPGAYSTARLPHWDFLMILRCDERLHVPLHVP